MRPDNAGDRIHPELLLYRHCGSLRRPQGPIARNPRICEALFLTHYIEKYGTGTLMMIRESLAQALSEPDFAQRGGEFAIAVWRDWLTDAVIDELGLNERQRKPIAFVKTNGRITNKEYQGSLAVSKPTASRDLELLRRVKVFTKMGSTGKGTYYVLSRKGLTKGSMGSSVIEGHGFGKVRRVSWSRKASEMAAYWVIGIGNR